MSQALRQEISQSLADKIKAGVLPWHKPWSSDPNICGLPTNVVSKKPYRGINSLILTASDYQSKWWGTAKQWKSLGGTIVEGTKAKKIVFCMPVSKIVTNRSGEQKKRTWTSYRSYDIFNLDCVQGNNKRIKQLRAVPPEQLIEALPDYVAANEIIEATKADIRYGGVESRYIFPEPYSSWPNHGAGDYITVPHQRQFVNIDSFYSTLFHELAHWAELRVGWSRTNFENTYETAELIAEITACFLASELKLPHSYDLDNASRYVGHWLEKMRLDPNYIFTVALQAHKVTDYILSLGVV